MQRRYQEQASPQLNVHSQHSFQQQSLEPQTEIQFQRKYRTTKLQSWPYRRHVQIIIVFSFITILAYHFYNFPSTSKCNFQAIKQPNPFPFSKVLWLYTENEIQAESMHEVIYLYHFNETFSKQGYEVKLVNSWNVYDFISNQTTARITKAMQNSKIDEGVDNLLKLALLAEKGGVMINAVDTVFVDEDLSWIQGLFNSTIKNNKQYTLPAENAEIFLYNFNESGDSFEYSPSFVAARPNSTLLRKAFETLQDLISTGTYPYANQMQILFINEDTQIEYLRNGLRDSINLAIFKHMQETEDLSICSTFGMQSLKHKNYILLNQLTYLQQQSLLLKQNYLSAINNISGYHVNLLLNVNQAAIEGFLNSAAQNIDILDPKPLPQNSLITRVLSAPNNKQIFIDPLPKREIQLCLIVMENLSKSKINIMRNAFSKQTYQNWKLILPADYELTDTNSKSSKVQLMAGRSTKVHNIEQACTKHCDPKGYAVLFNFGDTFNSPKALEQIASTLKPRDIAGAFIGIEERGNLSLPQVLRFHRAMEGIVSPNIPKMQKIINHFRIFSIDLFRYIPQFDLRNIYGEYFEDRLIFLMSMLQAVFGMINQPRIHYLAKKYAEQFNIPSRLKAIDKNFYLRVLKKDTVNLKQLRETRPRLDAENIEESIYNSVRWKIPISKLIALNPGDNFVSVNHRKGPQLIPKIIHQVWLGASLPPVKEYFYKKAKKVYPDYEVKLYRNENITREKFPLTYDILQTLLEFNKRSPYNKFATVTDIVRHEILYHQGGFWKDAGMDLLRPVFDKFLTFKLVITADKTFRHRWLQGMCFYGNMPKLEHLWRITNYRNTNRMRIYHNFAMIIAGPIDFRQLIVGQQEYDPDILIMPYETVYPAQIGQHPDRDLCIRSKSEIGGGKYQIAEKDCYLLPNCSQIYPKAFAVEHNCYGNTWAQRGNTWPQRP